MNTRIFNLRKSLNLTQKEFGETIGMSHGSLSDIERGVAPVTERTIIAICSKFNVNEEWLRSGEGDMFVIENKKFDEFFSIYNNLHPVLQDFLLQTAKNLLDIQKQF